MSWQNYPQQPPQQYAQQQYAYPYGNANSGGYYNYNPYAQQQQNHTHPYHVGAYPSFNTVTVGSVPPPPPPRPEKFHCAACDKTCDSAKALRAHTLSHVNCSHPGCTFSASQKVVSAHFAQKHGRYSGEGIKEVSVNVPGFQTQRFKVCVGNDPEDVKNWIEERKRNWPSKANIARKAAEKKRRLEEGCVTTDDGVQSKKAKWDESYLTKNKNGEENETDGCGLTSLVAGYGSSDSDEDEDDEKDSGQCKPAEEATDEKAIATISSVNLEDSNNFPLKRNQRHCRFFLRGKCNNGDKCSFLHDRDAQEANKKKQKSKSPRKQQEGQTLLRKLLDRDIRREASLTLQCLRYISDCNFFRAAED